MPTANPEIRDLWFKNGCPEIMRVKSATGERLLVLHGLLVQPDGEQSLEEARAYYKAAYEKRCRVCGTKFLSAQATKVTCCRDCEEKFRARQKRL